MRKDSCRIRPSRSQVLFLKYIYAHKLSRYEDASGVQFEIDHVVPVSLLKRAVKASGAAGIPISPISNLCLLRRTTNRQKRDKTLYAYLDRTSDEMRETVEDRALTRREDLQFVNDYILSGKRHPQRFLAGYLHFLENRFGRMKDEFFRLNEVKRRRATLFDELEQQAEEMLARNDNYRLAI